MTDSATTQPISYRPDLPDWGVYLRWPTAGSDWIYPDDRELAKQLLPSARVFRRGHWDGEFYHLNYGKLLLRVHPSLWVRVPAVDLEVGQQVELLYRHGLNDAGIYRIADIYFAAQTQEFEYYLQSDSLRLERAFHRDDLRPLHVQHHLRQGYFVHANATPQIPNDVELLNVGKLTSEEV